MTAGLGINDGLLEVAVTVRVWFSLTLPEEMPVRLTDCAPAFSLVLELPIGFNVGCWLTALTVTVKDWETTLLLAPPSLTVTVMMAEPLALAAGVKASEPVELGLV